MRDQHRELRPDVEERTRARDEREGEKTARRRSAERKRRAKGAARRRLDHDRMRSFV